MKDYKHVNYIHFNSISSTSTWVRSNLEMLDPQQMTCITAQEQTAGKGRFQRKWISPKGENLCATYYFSVPSNSSYIPNLGQILGISCCETLINFGFSPQVKWPNDILIDKKKISGILCETTSIGDSLGIILGIGLNINMTDETLHKIDQPATSLKIISGKEWDIKKILTKLSECFLKNLNTLKSEGFQPFAPFCEEVLAFKGQEVTFQDGNRLLSGICHTLSKNGNLILLSDSGEETEVLAGAMVSTHKQA